MVSQLLEQVCSQHTKCKCLGPRDCEDNGRDLRQSQRRAGPRGPHPAAPRFQQAKCVEPAPRRWPPGGFGLTDAAVSASPSSCFQCRSQVSAIVASAVKQSPAQTTGSSRRFARFCASSSGFLSVLQCCSEKRDSTEHSAVG